MAVVRVIGDRRCEGLALGNLGNAHYSSGEPRKAIEFQKQALVIAREIGDRRGEGNVLVNLGVAYAGFGEPRKAIEFYEQPLTDRPRDRRPPHGGGYASWNLGLKLIEQGERERGLALMQVNVDYKRELGHPDAEKLATQLEELRREGQK